MSTDRRLVLSVGMAAYNKAYLPPLHGTVQDALSMAQTAALTPGFNTGDVSFMEDLSCWGLKQQLLKLKSQILKSPEEVGLVLTYLPGQLLPVAWTLDLQLLSGANMLASMRRAASCGHSTNVQPFRAWYGGPSG